jgi:hypothetical protein
MSHRRLVPVLIAALAIAGLACDAALAANSGSGSGGSSPKKATPIQPLALTSETIFNNLNPAAPMWCLNEDDSDLRAFYGSLNGSFATSYQLCDISTDYSGGMYWSAGGEGVQTDVDVVGMLTDLAITAPDGTMHHAILLSQSTTKGVTTYHYAACYVPPYSISTDQGTDPLAGGAWAITLSGQISRASWTTRAEMTDVAFQQTYCPSSEQNLTP